MPWSKMLFPLLFLALGAACLWAAWVFRRFAKKRETAYMDTLAQLNSYKDI